MTYMMAGALYCECCAEDIQKEVKAEWAAANPDEEFDDNGDSEGYPQACFGLNNETDSPEHCDSCHRPLEYTLTNEGVDYVLKVIREDLKKGTAPRTEDGQIWTWPLTRNNTKQFFGGLDSNATTRDWAETLLECLDDEHDKRTVELFLYFTRPVRLPAKFANFAQAAATDMAARKVLADAMIEAGLSELDARRVTLGYAIEVDTNNYGPVKATHLEEFPSATEESHDFLLQSPKKNEETRAWLEGAPINEGLLSTDVEYVEY